MRSLIIHVDDRPSYRETFRGLVEPKGYRLRGYNDSESAASELKTQEPFLAVVDSIGFEFAKQLRKTCPQCRIIVLCTEPPTVADFADAIVPKGAKDWLFQVLECAETFSHELEIASRNGLDLFSDDQKKDELRGKIAVLCFDDSRKCERIIATFNSLNDAITWLKDADKSRHYRIVQGPPADVMSLVEFEGVGSR